MNRFCALYQSLDQTTSTKAKVAAMVQYFSTADEADAAWALYFLSGRRLKRLVGSAQLRLWLAEKSELPNWLIEETYSSVGDLAETISLLLARPDALTDNASMSKWVENQILPLAGMSVENQKIIVLGWWDTLPYEQCYICTKLITGALRVGVSQILLARAIGIVADLPRAVILHRLMGEWQPNAKFYNSLIAEDDGAAQLSRPYPFCLAAPIEGQACELGDVTQWQAEWKWDGIRAQLIKRDGEIFLWSRGEELIGERFPEIVQAAESLQDGTVLDGEILAWDDQGVRPFNDLQRRIGRKKVGKKLLSEVPCILLTYDLLELNGLDIRDQPLSTRREELESVIPESGHAIRIADVLNFQCWDSLSRQRELSRENQVEGLMLKDTTSRYGTGRQRGLWWKWKIEPYTIDAVMLYAQAGHGRRANLFTDYTFGVWHEGTIVPIAKAYSGLTDKEINRLDKWVRANTIEKFGPVRSVEKTQVFELAFEGIGISKRHKSGIAVRFPRIVRWREDKKAADSDTLETMKRLISTSTPSE